MHYCVFVLFKRKPTDKDIEKALVPFQDDPSEPNQNAHWDWYEIGGRWSGCLGGKLNIRQISYVALTDDNLPFAYVVDGEWVRKDNLTLENILEIADHEYVAVIDCHF